MGHVHRRTEKLFRWENIEIGDQYGPVVGVIGDFEVKCHAFAVDDYGDWYFRDSTPFGGRICHPTLLAGEILSLYRLGYAMPGPHVATLHARNELELIRPLFVGEEVTLRARNVEKFEKRGRNYRVLEGEVLDRAERVLLRMRATATVPAESNLAPRGGDGARGPKSEAPRRDGTVGEVPEGAPVVERASRDAPVGALLPSLTKRTSLEQSIVYSGFHYAWAEGGATALKANTHTDPDLARGRGLSDALIQGLIPNAYISELCAGFFGPLWLTTGHLSVSFTRPVYVRDTITTSALVKGREEEGDRDRIELDVWCKNQRGEIVVVGQASAQAQ